jgi:hypothetical protein
MALLGLFPGGSTSGENDQWERSGMRRFIAAFDSSNDEVYARSNLGSSYVINYPHPSDSGQVVSNIEVKQIEEPSRFADPTNPANTLAGSGCYWWDVTITYGPWNPLTHTATGNPVDQPITFSFDWQTYQAAADVAWNPSTSAYVPVVNSAGDPFDPPVTRELLRGIMRVAWNALSFSPATYASYGNCINSDVWNSFPIGSVKFTPPKMAERLWSQYLAQNYYRLEAEFCFFSDNSTGSWNAQPIDRGFRALDGSYLYKILDQNGQPISQPALLNGSGAPLNTSLGSYYQFNYQIYPSISFNSTFPALTTLFP